MLVHQVLAGKGLTGVVTLPSATTVAEASRILTEKKIGTVVVSEDGVTADGILSERDIVRELAKGGSSCLEKTIGNYMTKSLVTCSPDANTKAIMSQMTEGRFRHMPVLKDGELVGLISLGDVVKAELKRLSMEKNALEGMIMGH